MLSGAESRQHGEFEYIKPQDTCPFMGRSIMNHAFSVVEAPDSSGVRPRHE